jgi:hypothetical protein
VYPAPSTGSDPPRRGALRRVSSPAIGRTTRSPIAYRYSPRRSSRMESISESCTMRREHPSEARSATPILPQPNFGRRQSVRWLFRR